MNSHHKINIPEIYSINMNTYLDTATPGQNLFFFSLGLSKQGKFQNCVSIYFLNGALDDSSSKRPTGNCEAVGRMKGVIFSER